MYINKNVLKRLEPRYSLCIKTILSLKKGTSYTKIGTCSSYKYSNFFDFQPKNLTLGV